MQSGVQPNREAVGQVRRLLAQEKRKKRVCKTLVRGVRRERKKWNNKKSEKFRNGSEKIKGGPDIRKLKSSTWSEKKTKEKGKKDNGITTSRMGGYRGAYLC